MTYLCIVEEISFLVTNNMSWNKQELAALKQCIKKSQGFLEATESINRLPDCKVTLAQVKAKWADVRQKLLAEQEEEQRNKEKAADDEKQKKEKAAADDEKQKKEKEKKEKEGVKKEKEKEKKEGRHKYGAKVDALLAKCETSTALRDAFPGGMTSIFEQLGMENNKNTYSYVRRRLMVAYGKSLKDIYCKEIKQQHSLTFPDGLKLTFRCTKETYPLVVQHMSMYKALDATKREIEGAREILSKRKRDFELLEAERTDYKRALMTLEYENSELRARLQVHSLLTV